jgi:integrase
VLGHSSAQTTLDTYAGWGDALTEQTLREVLGS